MSVHIQADLVQTILYALNLGQGPSQAQNRQDSLLFMFCGHCSLFVKSRKKTSTPYNLITFFNSFSFQVKGY